MHKIKKYGLLLTILASYASYADTPNDLGQKLYDDKPYSLLYYYGITVSDPLMRIFRGEIHRWPEHIQSVELAKTLNQDNIVRRFFSPICGVVQLAGNVTYRVGSNQNNIYEFDPYLIWRFANWPWNHKLTTSLALAEGVSYTTSIPSIEQRNNDNTKRFLNYLMFEATFALPSYPDLQIVARIHHRSGAYGAYHAGNTGSNDIGIGIRYLFD